MTLLHILLLYALIINAITFVIYGIDKLKAKRGWWRITERSLLSLALLGGSLGAWMAMQTFRHKTQHAKFKYGVPAALLCHLILAIWLTERLGAALLTTIG